MRTENCFFLNFVLIFLQVCKGIKLIYNWPKDRVQSYNFIIELMLFLGKKLINFCNEFVQFQFLESFHLGYQKLDVWLLNEIFLDLSS
jgi:hypothetical protein